MSNSPERYRKLADMAGRFADLILPRQCGLCLADPGAGFLCPGCLSQLPLLQVPACPTCALPAPGGLVCGACQSKPPAYDATLALYQYAYPVDQLIHALKYAHRLASADFFGSLMAGVPLPEDVDIVLPVPLSSERLAERGFNQSVELARPVARKLGLRLETAAVQRHRDTRSQSALAWKSRAANVRGAFNCRADLSGRSILVIDDVMTTGATLDELAQTLKAAGARRVANLVACRTMRD